MARVPCVNSNDSGEILAAVLGVVVAALEVRIGKRFQERYPALVQSGDQRQGTIDGETAVFEASPGGLVVGLDGRPVFSEGELRSDVCVGVAVGDVMHELANGPAAFAVGGVELRLSQSVDGVRKLVRKESEGGKLLGANCRFS